MSIDLNSTNISLSDDPPFFEKLQGNILRPQKRTFVSHLLLRFLPGKVAEARAWIRGFVRTSVTSAADQERGADQLFRGFYLSFAGYQYLGRQAPMEAAYVDGMQRRGSMRYGDPPWDQSFPHEIHAMMIVAADSQDARESLCREVQDSLQPAGDVVTRQDGAVLKNDKGQVIENFGFRDGISQPLFFADDIAAAGPTTAWDPSAQLKLILTDDPLGGAGTYGSFLVYRKLRQDVTEWNSKLESLASTLKISTELAGAYAVGRFQDGTPVLQRSTPSGEAVAPNDFNYAEDPTGARCPFQSHMRKSNPRGDTTTLPNSGGTISLELERSHRISRRQSGYTDPDNTVGLHWLCFGGTIVEQFEFMQTGWINTNHFVQQSVGLDVLIGQGTPAPLDGQSFPKTWGGAEFQRFDMSKFTLLRGGEFFFAPSLPSLENM